MNIEYIDIPSGTKYLGEVMSEFPENCIFNKGVVGCGGTTIALTNDKDYIICVPFKALIDNKVSSNDGILGVTGETSEKEILDYVNQPGSSPKKIMVTYDSLEKLMSIVGTEYSLLIDEFHLLFTQYPFRKKAVSKVLKHYDKFREYCFMTATVLEEEFILDELKDLRIIEAKWQEVEEVTVRQVKCTKGVLKTTVGLVNRFLSGEMGGNAYFFVNSLNFIKDVVQNCNLNNENTRIIWSENNSKEIPGFTKGKTTDAPKTINFLTSTCFEGSDIFDADGKTFIVSDNRRSNTYLDISTSIRQIAGRIRNSKYKGIISHIFSNTRYSEVTELTFEEFKRIAEVEIDRCKDKVDRVNKMDSDLKPAIDVNKLNVNYVTKINEDTYAFDANLVKIDLYNFKLTKFLYASPLLLKKEYESRGFTVQEHTLDFDIELLTMETGSSFKETVEYLRLNQFAHFNDGTPLDRAPFERYPFLEKAIEALGFEGLEAENYHITNIKRKLNQKLDGSEYTKIFQSLNNLRRLKSGDFIESKQAKELLRKVYSDLGINRSPKGSDLGEFFELKQKVKYVKGSNKQGYEIIMAKPILGKTS